MTAHDPAILVVDDVAENRDLLVRRLQRLGINRIDQAEDGVQALQAIAYNAYDLVLLDIMMPELDGFGVLEELRKDGRINDLPVVVISALNELEPVVRCIELGADDFIFKPFNPTLLRARVQSTLEKKALRDRTREELKRKLAELNEARTLQLSLVPRPYVGTVGGRPLWIDVLLDPAKEVGGDLVDYFFVGNRVVLALGDVSDKGAGAALMMARTHALFRSLSTRPDAAELFGEPERAMGAVNAALSEGNDGCSFVTFLLATFDLESGQLSYVRAGHLPPYLRKADGTIVRLNLLSGPPLGIDGTVQFRSAPVTLEKGDRVLIVTDGFTEAENQSGEFYGDEQVERFLGQLPENEPDPLVRLWRNVREFEEGTAPSDDMAAILLTLTT